MSDPTRTVTIDAPPAKLRTVVFPIVSRLLIRPGVQEGLDLRKAKVGAER
jgi:hypothetical protein